MSFARHSNNSNFNYTMYGSTGIRTIMLNNKACDLKFYVSSPCMLIKDVLMLCVSSFWICVMKSLLGYCKSYTKMRFCSLGPSYFWRVHVNWADLKRNFRFAFFTLKVLVLLFLSLIFCCSTFDFTPIKSVLNLSIFKKLLAITW